MTTKVRGVIVGLASLSVVLCMTDASYAYIGATGHACHEAITDSRAARDHYGFYNNGSTGAVEALCPVSVGSSSSYTTSLTVGAVTKYTDQNSGLGLTVSCHVDQWYSDGSFSQSSVKYSCSTAGGCTTNGNTYTGFNYLSWTTTELTFSSVNVDSDIAVHCTLPSSTGAGSSYVLSTNMD